MINKNTKLVRAFILDLVSDLRFCRSNGKPADEIAKLERDLRNLFTNRHHAQLDRYGWPLLLK